MSDIGPLMSAGRCCGEKTAAIPCERAPLGIAAMRQAGTSWSMTQPMAPAATSSPPRGEGSGVGFRLRDLFPERHGFTVLVGSGRPLSRGHILLAIPIQRRTR
jgi:hypothetical protein